MITCYRGGSAQWSRFQRARWRRDPYQWTAPTGIVLNNPQSASPSFTVTAAHQNDTLSFLLVVSDGKLFATDVVKGICATARDSACREIISP